MVILKFGIFPEPFDKEEAQQTVKDLERSAQTYLKAVQDLATGDEKLSAYHLYRFEEAFKGLNYCRERYIDLCSRIERRRNGIKYMDETPMGLDLYYNLHELPQDYDPCLKKEVENVV